MIKIFLVMDIFYDYICNHKLIREIIGFLFKIYLIIINCNTVSIIT
jgi:hypothetical protein